MTTASTLASRSDDSGVRVFVIGISGSVGGGLAQRLLAGGTLVRGLVRSDAQRSTWMAQGAEIEVADLATATVADLAAMLDDVTTIVYAAGSNGGAREVTDAIDDAGVTKTVEAATQAGVRRLILLSVMPEAWRERDLDDDEEYYFATKKRVDVLVSRSDLDWLIIRPSLLLDEPGTGRVSLGPAQVHRGVPREDVVHVLSELIVDHRVSRQILELDRGDTPVSAALKEIIVRRRWS